MSRTAIALAATLVLVPSLASAAPVAPPAEARVVVAGIAEPGAVAPVGTFHAGGPIHDVPAFAAATAPGRVLDPSHVLVAAGSNFGAPEIAGTPPGAVLSIDPSGPPFSVPRDFGRAGGQASALGGRVQLFSSSSPGFRNAVNSPRAVTSELPAVSRPLGISINNAFGRLWFANGGSGGARPGFESIADATGIPLANAPDAVAGGVFTTSATNRAAQRAAGRIAGAVVATALMGPSPDGSKRAVFAALVSDGSVVQIHTEQGLDGLAQPGTVTPQRAPFHRAGMLFNWVPDRVLFVTDAEANAVRALPLGDDRAIFTTDAPRALTAGGALRSPIDLAPVVPEIANGAFSSSTTLAGGSDIYVLNADGTIVRMRTDGTYVASRSVAVRGEAVRHLSGIATSADASHLWLTTPDAVAGMPPGALLEIPAFDAGSPVAVDPDEVRAGAAAFARSFDVASGLGPLFNERSCLGCHSAPAAGGMAPGGLKTVSRIARVAGRFDAMEDDGGPVAHAHAIAELGSACPLHAGIPAGVNAVSLRNAPALYESGAIASVSDDAIVAGVVAYSDGVHGRPNWLIENDGLPVLGRFGWKADVGDLPSFVAIAFRNELGITSPSMPRNLARSADARCGSLAAGPTDDGTLVRRVTAFLASLQQPPSHRPHDARGERIFGAIGCAECHAVALRDGTNHPIYSDLLLHDMGPALDDGFTQGSARGADWRTTPLAGLGTRTRLLHDGRASSLHDAIVAHDGEAAPAVRAFRALSPDDENALIAFLGSL